MKIVFENFSLGLSKARARLLVADLAVLLADDLQVVVSVLLDVEGPLLREQLHLPGDVADRPDLAQGFSIGKTPFSYLF